MAHKTLVESTAYTIKGGKDLIGGTAYKKKKGRTLVEGTVYEVGFAKPVTITIEGSGGDYAQVVIDGVTYNSAATVEVPIGTVISCVTNHYTSMGAESRIRVNGQTVVKAVKATYDYTVVGDATITLSTMLYNTTMSYVYGNIEIVDANAPNLATVNITLSGTLSGVSNARVTIDGDNYGNSPISLCVPLGTVIVCKCPWTTHQMYGSYGGEIKLNGTVVASRADGVAPTTYEHTVNKDVVIAINQTGSPVGVVANMSINEQ